MFGVSGSLKKHLAVVILLLLFIMPGLSLVHISDQLLDSYFAQDDPRYLRLSEIQSEFDGFNPIIIGISTKTSINDANFLAKLRDYEDKIRSLTAVTEVISIRTMPRIVADSGNIKIVPLIDSIKSSPDDGSKTDGNAQWNFFVSRDLKKTLLLVKHSESEKVALKSLIENLQQLSFDFSHSFETHVFGLAVIQMTIFDTIVSTLRYVAPLSAFVMLSLLLFVTRSAIFSLIPIVIVIVSIFLSFAISGYLGFSITGVSMGVPQILLAIGICDCMHIFSSYDRLLKEGYSLEKARRDAINLNLIPTFLTTITTAIAFASFVISDIKATSEFGIICAIGTILTWYLSLVIMDLVFAMRKPQDRQRLPGKTPSFLGDKFSLWLNRNKKRILLIFFPVVLAGLSAIPSLKLGSDFHKAFPKEAKITKSIEFFAENFGFINMRTYYLSCGDKNCIYQASFLNQFKTLLKWLESEELVISTQSLIDVFDIVHLLDPNQTLNHDAPYTQNQIEELRSILSFQHPSQDPLKALVNNTGKLTKMEIYINSGNLQQGQALEKMLSLKSKELNIQLEAADFQSLLADVEAKIIPQLGKSMMITLIAIVIVLAFVFRNWKLVMLALIPNLIALLALVNVFYLFDISITTNTMIVWCVGLGVAVDDTIHFLFHFQKSRKSGTAIPRAIETAFKHSGQAIVNTTLILAVGFGTSIFGTYLPGVHAGLLLMAAVILALLCDLICLPAILLLSERQEAK